MPFLDLDIMADQPSDPKVNVITQLNDNWDSIDLSFRMAQNNGIPISGQEVGQQYVDNNTNAVWNGSAWVTPTNWMNSWSAWTQLSGYPEAGMENLPFNPLKYRTNPVIRQVEMAGSVRFTSSGLPWDSNYHQFSPSAVGVPIAFAPIDDKTIQPCPVFLLTESGFSSNALMIAERRPAQTQVWLQIKHNGNMNAVNNYISFDNVRWFY